MVYSHDGGNQAVWLDKFKRHFVYCGVTREEYNSVKKMAYAANFRVWKYLHLLFALYMIVMTISTFTSDHTALNVRIYSILTVYAVIVLLLFAFFFKEDSFWAQLVIYLTMILLLCGTAQIGLKRSDMMAVSFTVMLVFLPAFMIDKPFYMALVLTISVTVYLTLTSMRKDGAALQGDFFNCIFYGILGIIINTFYNSLRVREFLLQKLSEEQRDTDDLTGLGSRRYLMQCVRRDLETHSTGLLMIMDVDHFKKVNDHFGHDAGDTILREVAVRMKQLFGDTAILGRYGGDEFIAWIPDSSEPSVALSRARQLIDTVNREVHLPDPYVILGISIGIGVRDKDAPSYDALFQRADQALYEAKEKGRNRVCTWHK